MNLYGRIAQYHSRSRSAFILFTELIAFTGTLATMIAIASLRELLS
jgi:hypothetical protein